MFHIRLEIKRFQQAPEELSITAIGAQFLCPVSFVRSVTRSVLVIKRDLNSANGAIYGSQGRGRAKRARCPWTTSAHKMSTESAIEPVTFVLSLFQSYRASSKHARGCALASLALTPGYLMTRPMALKT
jgi:hypothetical protein